MAFPTAQQLTEFLREPIARMGLELETVTTTPAGKKSKVEVAVDADERPGVDQLEACSNKVSELLDDAEEAGTFRFGAGYTLQITTRGVDQPLTGARHWRRNRGRLVEISGADGTVEHWRIGPLDDAEETVALVHGENAVSLRRIADIDRAVVQVEFAPAPAQEVERAAADFAALAQAAGSSEGNRKEDK